MGRSPHRHPIEGGFALCFVTTSWHDGPKFQPQGCLVPFSRSPNLNAWRSSALVLALLTAWAAGPAHAASDSHVKGAFGPVVDWPLIPLHAVVLPDGRVMSYGTDAQGQQGARLIYDVWAPSAGTGANAHLTLPNTTATDIFCNGQILLPGSGQVLLTGGDKTILGKRNYSVRDVNFFDPVTDALRASSQPMRYLRWYPSLLTTANGEVLVMGGRPDPILSSLTSSPTPEVFTAGGTWRTLTGATSEGAYGRRNWSYPRAWQAPQGKVFIATIWGGTYFLDPAGKGSIKQTALTLPVGDVYLPSVSFAPGRVLSLRKNNSAVVIDFTGATPTAQAVTGVGQDRYHASATVMADGRVLVNGGSEASNEAKNVAYTAMIWDPATAAWQAAATAVQMRLYHSVSLLLPDGRVLTGGGGAPGPQTNLNAELYHPPYLYKADGSGQLAPRPVITSAPATATWGGNIQVGTDATSVSRVTLVKTGSATHTVDFDQRFLNLGFTGAGASLQVAMPGSRQLAPPGFYMLFVFDGAGVPSVAKVIRLG